MNDRHKQWQETLSSFCLEFDFPEEATQSLSWDLSKIIEGNPALCCLSLEGYLDEYEKEGEKAKFSGGNFSHWEALEVLGKGAEQLGISPYAVHMLFYILLSPVLRKIYRREGIPEEIFRDSMVDLRCKLLECKQVCGVWGSFVAIWFSRFFCLTLFGIGRLEFAPMRFSENFAKAFPSIPEGAMVIDTHIPSRGALPHEEVMASYRKAAEFFKKRYDLSGTGGAPVFLCESWMLDPGHFDLPEMQGCQNILAFQKDYQIFESGKDSGGSDLWRIFGRNVDMGDKAAFLTLPEDTSLQRAYKRRLLAGDQPGYGIGVFFLPE